MSIREISDLEKSIIDLANHLPAGTIIIAAKTRTGYRKFTGIYRTHVEGMDDIIKDVTDLRGMMLDSGDDNK